MSIINIIRLSVLAALMVAIIAIKMLLSSNAELKAEALVLKAEIQIREENLDLLDDLLEKESADREIAQAALTDLAGKVPNVVYTKKLPPSIQKVVDRFHTGIASKR